VVLQTTPRWQPASLPPGFKLASHNGKTGSGDLYEHLVYSDGLAAVSVYIEYREGAKVTMPRMNRLGTNHAYTRYQDSFQITVIGEVPIVTVTYIGDEMARSIAAD
jgi:sigma-E factor negative regulatory protein RseB